MSDSKKISKSILGAVEPDAERLKLLNRHTKREMTAEEVYAFRVVLCDNEVDRDFERFTLKALEELAELFDGKTGILDHTPKAQNQIARIFKTEVQTDATKRTSLDEPYTRLIAEAYIPKTPKNEEFIQSLEAGIHKEVSVGCAVKRRICSVCGADTAKEYCEHRKGETYKQGATEAQCHILLDEPYDAYEWSFVAVPAQRAAGVIKGFDPNRKEEKDTVTCEELEKALGTKDLLITKSQGEILRGELTLLRDVIRDQLKSVKKSCVKGITGHFPETEADEIVKFLEGLSLDKLKSIDELFKSEPEEVQLKKSENNSRGENEGFII